MKIGILTFHWATNYGAVLQTYALQTYLEKLGFDVWIINYQPYQWINKLSQIVHAKSIKQVLDAIRCSKRERSLRIFRKNKLNLTSRVYNCKQIPTITDSFDIIISGSDQVLSIPFLKNGDGKGKFTPSYYLGFPFKGKKIAFAASFGCTEYPKSLMNLVKPYIKDINSIGVRERSGKDIMALLGRDDAIVVPDPTVLLDKKQYLDLIKVLPNIHISNKYTYCFFIRNIKERKAAIKNILNRPQLWNNSDGNYSLEGWLQNIKDAHSVVTDSFHCVMMCLKFHTPFVVVTEFKGNVDMNDRMFTLLGVFNLTNRILHKDDIICIEKVNNELIDWDEVDSKMIKYKQIGVDFIENSFNMVR